MSVFTRFHRASALLGEVTAMIVSFAVTFNDTYLVVKVKVLFKSKCRKNCTKDKVTIGNHKQVQAAWYQFR